MKIESILFVCLGNICRSPLAEGVAKSYIEERSLNIKVESAGTGDWHIGEAPCENSIRIAKENGIDITNQKARQIDKKDFQKFDLIVGLDDNNVSNLKKLGCENPLKLGDFGFEGENIPDPYFFEGYEGFEKVFNMIETCVKTLINNKIKEL